MARVSSAGSQRSQQQLQQQNNTSINKKSSSAINEDDLFNDDYVAPADSDVEEGELKKTSQNSELDSDEDDFDSMLKTRSFSNSKSKLAQANKAKDNEAKEQNYIARATTPRPVPRKSNVSYGNEDDPYGSSDDEYWA